MAETTPKHYMVSPAPHNYGLLYISQLNNLRRVKLMSSTGTVNFQLQFQVKLVVSRNSIFNELIPNSPGLLIAQCELQRGMRYNSQTLHHLVQCCPYNCSHSAENRQRTVLAVMICVSSRHVQKPRLTASVLARRQRDFAVHTGSKGIE